MSSNPFARTTLAQSLYDNAKLPRALVGGDQAMRNGGKTYLPKWPMETEEAWASRRDSTFLYPGYADACSTATGLAFSEGVTLGEDVAAQIVDLWENVDYAGTHGDVFWANAFNDSLHVGVGHVLAEYPRAEGIETLADEREAGLRPYLIYVPGDAVLGWRVSYSNGMTRLVQFRYLEVTTEPDGNFGEKEVQRVRVYYASDAESPYARYEVYKLGTVGAAGANGEPILESAGPLAPHTEIPLSSWYAGPKTGYLMARPFFEGVASANLELWQSGSDQRANLHFARVSLFVFRGFTADEAKQVQAIGPAARIACSDAGAGVDVVGGNPAALGDGWKDMERLTATIRERSLKPLLSSTGAAETATGRAIDASREMSALERAMRSLQDAMEDANGNMAIWMGLDYLAGGSVMLAEELSPEPSQVDDVRVILDMHRAGLLSKHTALDESAKKLSLSDDFDLDAELERIEAEGGGFNEPADDGMDEARQAFVKAALANEGDDGKADEEIVAPEPAQAA